MIDTDTDRAPWSPYRLVVGQRVRVRFSNECREHVTRHHEDVLRCVDGVTGVVRATDDTREPGHPYDVEFDERVVLSRPIAAWAGTPGAGMIVVAGIFAISELEILEPAEEAR